MVASVPSSHHMKNTPTVPGVFIQVYRITFQAWFQSHWTRHGAQRLQRSRAHRAGGAVNLRMGRGRPRPRAFLVASTTSSGDEPSPPLFAHGYATRAESASRGSGGLKTSWILEVGHCGPWNPEGAYGEVTRPRMNRRAAVSSGTLLRTHAKSSFAARLNLLSCQFLLCRKCQCRASSVVILWKSRDPGFVPATLFDPVGSNIVAPIRLANSSQRRNRPSPSPDVPKLSGAIYLGYRQLNGHRNSKVTSKFRVEPSGRKAHSGQSAATLNDPYGSFNVAGFSRTNFSRGRNLPPVEQEFGHLDSR